MSSTRESDAVKQAKSILRGQSVELGKVKPLVNQLKDEKAFGYARKILQNTCLRPELGQQPPLRTWCIQQCALCTYKDPDLPAESKFDRALEILGQLGNLREITEQETLGLIGAIHKGKWENFGQKQYLEQSLAFYRRGYNEGIAQDLGYTAINAAFVLDQLANIDRQESKETGITPLLAADRRREAQQIRQEIVATLSALLKQPGQEKLVSDWWFLVTLAEAYFGLGRDDVDQYKEASVWLQKAASLPTISDWKRESTARQLATLARIQASDTDSDTTMQLAQTPAWDVLVSFLGPEHARGIQGIFIGKVGLGLSGGGFRASLFHIGVLARLAELDILRHVEVLSCVSGGSIVGAHYYLELHNLLKKKNDADITREDYIAIVRNLERDFLAGVQRNLRVRLLADFSTNVKMILAPNTYSRTQRIGELYEEELFSRVADGKGDQPRYMSDLLIQPKGEPDSFAPKNDNWRRTAKVPALILNATTLNTGHIWQFTATWMGEPPAGVDAEIDSNYRLRRMYYDEAPQGYRQVRLGQAVAASACVPGLFDPIVFPELYPDRIVRLVDGGVHDNQGTASLLEQGCSIVLVSDASGQMAAQDQPSNSLFGPPLRSNSILQARVREAQYHELDARRRASLLRGVMFVHLKKDLDSEPVNWVDCEDPQDAYDEPSLLKSPGVLTPYGIRKDIQTCLAAIRTDLDSFSDKEAYALMTSGYYMTAYEVDQSLPHLFQTDDHRVNWNFLAVENMLKERDEALHLKKYLGISSELFLKVWRLLPQWQQRTILALLVIPFGLAFAWACLRWPSFALLTLGMIGATVATTLAGFFVSKTVIRAVRFRETLTRVAFGIGVGFFACLFANIHLCFFDKKYLEAGSVEVSKE